MSRETFQKVMLEGDEVRELDFEDHEEFEVKYPSIIDYLSMKDRLAGSIEYKWIRPEKPTRICSSPMCLKVFIPTRGDNTYCSNKCLRREIDRRSYAHRKT